MSNRSGRQAIVAKTIIDATPRGLVARIAGARFGIYPSGRQTFKFTVVGNKPKSGPNISSNIHDEAIQINFTSSGSAADGSFEKANIQYKSVNFMRGRSIQNAIVILDESQNLTASQLKTIITRCGEGTKLIVGGNLAQIDSNYLSAVTSGLTYLVEKFKDFSGSATINLDGVVRSRLASFAEENL